MADSDHTLIEEWRSIPGFDEYEVSSFGRIRRIKDCRRAKSGQMLKGFPSGGGYIYVDLRQDGRKWKTGIHRVVASAFLPRPINPDANEVAHKDGSKTDNCVWNLRWSTRTENELDKLSHGTYYLRRGVSGEKHHKAKLTQLEVLEIRSLYTGQRGQIVDLSKKFGVSQSTIGRILSGAIWNQKN